MFNKKLVLGIMLLSLIGNNNTKGTQLGTPVINAEFSNPKSNKNVFEDLEKDLNDFMKTLVKEPFYQIQDIDDNELKEIYEEKWQEYDSYLENELSWMIDTFSDPPDEITKAMVDQLSEKIAMFKNKVLDFKFKIEQIQAEESRKNAWERVFLPFKNYEKIKKEVGEASINLTYEDSEKIASVIDSYLPGIYDNILDLCNMLRAKDMGTQFALVSGAPGWGKVNSIEYLIAATNAQKIVVSYSDLLKLDDGRKYAEDLLKEYKNKYKNKKEPLIMVLDKIDTISKSQVDQPNQTPDHGALLNIFLDEVKKITNDNGINLFIVGISNVDRRELNRPMMEHLVNQCFVFGSRPDYNRIIDSISQGFNCNPAENKENFISNIVKNCENLRDSGFAPSVRVIAKAFQTAQNKWLEKNNDGKPWNAVLNSQDIIENINSICKL